MAQTYRHVAGGAVLAVMACLGASAPAAAQETSLRKALGAIRSGGTVWVTTSDGVEVKGQLISIAADGVAVRTKAGVETIRPDRIVRVDRVDGVRDGIIKGALIGGLAAGVPAALYISNYGGCPCKDSDGLVMTFAGVGAGIGAGIGALGDTLRHGRRTVYGARNKVSLLPIVAPGRLAMHAAVRW